MECLQSAGPALVDIVSFAALCALLFGLSGIMFFSGSLRRHCVLPTGVAAWAPPDVAPSERHPDEHQLAVAA